MSTNYAQVYCTVAEVISDLGLSGDEPGLLDRVREASRLVLNRLGTFLPITESRTFVPTPTGELLVDPLLSVTAISNDGTAVTVGDCTLLPHNRLWLNGPYTQIANSGVGWSENGVTITGKWGKYDSSEALNISAVTQLLTATTMAVSDGSRLAAGMVVLIESEQELVTAGNGGIDSPAATAATSKLNGAIAADDEEITVDNGAEFKRGEVIALGTEDCFIRRIAGHVLVVLRGYNGTTKAAHADDLAMGVYRTFTVQRGVNGTTAAAHDAVRGATTNRVMATEDINWLTRQTAGLMRMKAAAGFASKTGNAELGETFYYSEFSTTFKKLWEDYKVR